MEGNLVTIASLWAHGSIVYDTVRLEAVQILSLSKTTMVPKNAKGKNKDKGKAKGKGGSKDKGNSKAKGKDGGEQEALQCVYVGRDGQSVALVASGAAVSKLPGSIGGRFDITALKPRIGAQGVLYLSDATKITVSCVDVARSPYESIVPTTAFATHNYAKEWDIGVFVDLVLWVQSCPEKATYERAEPFLEVYGFDLDGHNISALRLWRFVQSDMVAQCTYIVRGVRVVQYSHYDPEQKQYVKSCDGRKSFECSWRTAVENVSEVSEIVSCFV